MMDAQNRYAVIDLGTNTFHLLIVEKSKIQPFKEVYRERRFVKLAAEGIHQIGAAPFKRGIDTILDYQKILQQYEVSSVQLIATEGLRRASNGLVFIEKIKELTGYTVQLISGQEEARLIHLGVAQAIDFGEQNDMIIDIGGGSVEFIIANQKEVLWSGSFPIGVAVLFNQYHRHDPIEETEIQSITAFLEVTLQPLLAILPIRQPQNLIGASGAFEVVENMLPKYQQADFSTKVPIEAFYPLYNKIIAANLDTRLQMDGLPESRADLIVVAFILIQFILSKATFKNLLISDFALKEGALWEMMR